MDAFTELLGQPDEAAPDPLSTPATQVPAKRPTTAFDRMLDGPSEQDLRLGSNLNGAASTTPDAHAKAMDIGGTIGAPADAVAANMPESEKLARLQRYHDALNDAPKLAKLLAEDPDLAKISADDLKVLGNTERTLSFFGSMGRGVDIAQGMGYGFLEATGEATGVDSLTSFGRAGRIANQAEAQQYGDRSSLFDIRSFGQAGQYAKETAGEQIPLMAGPLAGGFGGAAAGFAVGGPVGATIGAIIGAFVPSLVLGVGETQGTIKDKDPDAVAPGYAFGAGALIAALDSALPGKVGSTLVRVLGREATEEVLKRSARALAVDTVKGATLEGTTEAVQEVIGEVAAAQATGQDVDARGLAEQMVEAFVVGFGMGGGVEGGTHVVGAIGRNRARATESAQNAAVVEALVKGTADSKLRERNPDAFAAVMAAQTQGTPVETFYVPATAIAELYQSGAGTFDDDPLNQIEGLREQLQEALAVGGDVEISAADYLTHIAPTDLHGRLKNDLRASRDGWSVNDAKAYAEDPAREADLSALVERLALQNEGAAVGQATFDDAYRQFMDTGKHESHQAAALATMVRERFIAQAAARGAGEDPDALYLRNQVQISGPGALARVRRGDLDLVIARLKSGETVQGAKTPVLDIVRKAGGVKLGSQLDSELRAMGVNPKTHPGLFKKTGGIGDVDNFVLSEHDVLRDNGVPDSGNGYADRGAVLEALRREAGGRGAALLTQDEREQRARLDEPVSVLAEQLDAAGLDVNTMTADEIKAWATGQQRQAAVPSDAQGALLQPMNAGVNLDREVPVIEVTPRFAGMSAREARLNFPEDLRRAIVASSPIVNRETGWSIEVTGTGFDHAMGKAKDSHGTVRNRLERIESLAVLPDILADAALIESRAPEKQTETFRAIHRLFAPVRINGRTYAARITVREFHDGVIDLDRFDVRRFHDLALDREVAPAGDRSSQQPLPQVAQAPGPTAGATINLRTLLTGVKGDDGEPYIQSLKQLGGQGVRGSYQRLKDPYGNLSNVIKLTEGANLSTALHEFGHFFLFQLIDDATLPGATAEARVKLQADLQTVLDHLGIKIDVATASADQTHAAMTREAHELWARSFEAYAREGKAPSAALRDAFASFASWLVRIYRTLSSIPDYRKKLTPEVRGVMDRLLATEDAIKDAQASSSFRVPSALRSVMTAAEQKSLERLTAQANMEAKEELTKRVMKELERERLEWWKEERAKVRDRVEADVRSRPVYRAYNLIRTGQTADGGQLVDENGNPRAMKLDRNLLERDYGKDIVKLLPKGLTAKDGASHHVVASLTGFGSTDELRDALLNIQPMKEVVEAETDAAMKQRHGDMLSDGRIAEDASEVVLNEKQLDLAALQAKALRRLAASVMEKAATRTVAETGAKSAAADRAAVLEAQADEEAVARTGIPAEGVAGVSAEAQMAAATAAASVGQRTAQRAALRQTRGVQSGLDVKAITAAAKKAIAGKRVEDAVPGRYRAQADRLGRQIEQAIAKRDYQKAATLKEQQLINLALAREAQEVQADVGKAVKRFARLNKPDAKLTKGTDVDFIGAARAVLAQFGLTRPQAGYDEQVWFQKLKENDPAGEADMREMIEAARKGAKPFRKLTVEEFRSLADTVDAILSMGRDARSVEIEGERLEIKAAVGDLIAQASSRDKGERIGQTAAVTWRQGISVKMLGVSAGLERMETWARRMDEGKVGPYTKYFIRPVLAAVYEYREAKGRHVKQLVDLLEPHRKELYGKPIHSTDLNYKFANKAALLHAILHSGNESNFRKLLLGGRGKGYAWGKAGPDGAVDTSRWDNMIRAMVRDGVLTKADYDLVQSIWDLLESTKGPAQLAHRKMKGFYFQEVEITGIDTPFGRYKGGYVPAISDRLLNADKAAHADAEAMGDLGNAGMLPSVARGFTKSRVEYNQPLELDLALLPSHVDKVLKFTYLGPVIRSVTRLAINRDFKEAMHGVDPTVLNNLVVPWLHRVSRQTLETPSTNESDRTSDQWWRLLRRNTAMQAMAGNVINALQQVTGLSTAMVRVKPGFMLRGLVTSVKAPRLSVEEIKRKSPLMRERMDGATQDLMHNLDEILSDKWVGFRLVDKANRHGYFAQAIMQNLVDRMVWLGGYEQATAAGKSDEEAALEADSIVRTTQGSFAPEDASKYEAKSAFVRAFTMFYSYFNAQMNLLRSEAEIAVRDSGWVGASPRLFYVYIVGAMIPAVLAEAMVKAAKGELGDGDDDDNLWDDIGELFGLSQLRYFAGMVPLVGPAVTAGINFANSKPYDDRLSTSPVVSSSETVLRTVFQHVPNFLSGEDVTARAIRDALTTLGMLTGLPIGQAGKPVAYISDVLSGEQEGETVGDWIRGTLSGREAPRP